MRCCLKEELVEHAMGCFVRLVRLLLGDPAIADDKCEFGPSLVILGVQIKMAENGYKLAPAFDEVGCFLDTAVVACISASGAEVDRYHCRRIRKKKITSNQGWRRSSRGSCPGAVPPRSNVSGGLCSGQGCQLPCVRVKLLCDRPLFDQKSKRDGEIDIELRAALEWWLDVLRMGVCELRPWDKSYDTPVHLFVDASGSPPYLGAVLFCDGRIQWTHMAPSSDMMKRFRSREDNQIMGLELLAGRNVVIHSDNSGAEISVRRGTSRALDHAQLVHAQWFQLTRLRVNVFIKRVHTDDNIADLPSRCEFSILREGSALEVPPALCIEYQGDAWEILQDRWRLGRPAPVA